MINVFAPLRKEFTQDEHGGRLLHGEQSDHPDQSEYRRADQQRHECRGRRPELQIGQRSRTGGRGGNNALRKQFDGDDAAQFLTACPYLDQQRNQLGARQRDRCSDGAVSSVEKDIEDQAGGHGGQTGDGEDLLPVVGDEDERAEDVGHGDDEYDRSGDAHGGHGIEESLRRDEHDHRFGVDDHVRADRETEREQERETQSEQRSVFAADSVFGEI